MLSKCGLNLNLNLMCAIKVWANAIKVWANAIEVWANAIRVWANASKLSD